MIRYSEFCEICKELNLEVHRDYIFTNEKYTHDIVIDGVLANTDIECVCRLFSEKYRYKHQNITPEPNKRIYEFEYLEEFIPDKDYPRPDLVHPKWKKVKLFFNKEYVKKCLKQSLKVIKDLETYKIRYMENQKLKEIQGDFK